MARQLRRHSDVMYSTSCSILPLCPVKTCPSCIYLSSSFPLIVFLPALLPVTEPVDEKQHVFICLIMGHS